MKSILHSVALAALLGTAATFLIGASPAVELPRGWTRDGNELVWTSEAPLRMGGARYEFRSGTRLLGFPIQAGDSFRLRLAPRTPLTELSVWAAGRRIDMRLETSRITPLVSPAEPAIVAAAADPAAPGAYQTRRLHYALAPLVIPEFPQPVEVLGEVTAPVRNSGPMPLVLFLHGRHSTCFRGGADGIASGDWPCPPGWRPVPSHTGYRYIADVLASQGYLTVSIAANGINAQDGLFADGGAFARSELIRHHLAKWAEWNAVGGDPWDNRFQGRVNLDEVVLVGHSRGGEGVARATIDSDEDNAWKIQGLVLIGPTAFGRQVAPGVHTTVILPYCDGDVFDLQGQQYVDIGRDLTPDRALRSSVLAMGTNHNYYNTEWTPGLSQSPAWDDWYDSDDLQCGETRDRRLTPTEQQAVGLAYTAALVDLVVAQHLQSLPLLDGTRVKPPSMGRARVFVHAIGGDKRVLYTPGKTEVSATALTTQVCRGYLLLGPFNLVPGCASDLSFELTPHWIPMSFVETAPAPRALEVQWGSAGGSLQIPVSPKGTSADGLDFRMAGDPGSPPIEFDVRVRDASGAWTQLSARPLKLYSYHGPSPLGKAVAHQLRARVRDTNVDLGSITAIELIPRTPNGRFWLLDVSTWKNSLAASEQIQLPRVSAVDVVTLEGDSGQVTLNVPIRIEGPVRKRAWLWIQLTDFADFEDPMSGFQLVLEPGAESASFPFTYEADDAYNPYPQSIQVTLLAKRNAVTGDFDGTILVEEDDPPPVLTVAANHVSATEGGSLTWTFRLSEPLADGAFWTIEFRPALQFPELDTDDVPASYLARFGILPPEPAVPLSELGLFLGIEFAPGERVARLRIPIAEDGVVEGTEGVALLLDGFEDPVVPEPIEITGTVTP